MGLPAIARRRGRRLAPRLLGAIVLASTLLALCATAIQLYLDYSRDLDEIDRQFAQIERSYADSLASSLWSFDTHQMRLQIEGIVKMRDVQFAEVRGLAGEHFAAGVPAQNRQQTRQYTLRAPTAGQPPLGTLTVSVDMRGVYDRLLDRTLVILATQATKTFFIALFILFIVSHWVTRHLERMSRYAEGLSVDRLETRPLALERGGHHAADELDDVAVALNDMRERLATELARRKEAEQALVAHRDQLELLVRRRTEELEAAKERAEVANQAKSSFLARMSHELRTPLNAILGYAQIMKINKAMPEERRAIALDTIQASGEHLLTLIVDILDLAKIEAGKVEVHPAPLELRQFLRGIAEIVRVKAEEKQLRFEVDVAPGVPERVRADEQRLRQVLLNLLGNAVKFTDAGHVRLVVRPLEGGDTEARLRFEVADSGVGIAQDQQVLIFEPFQQAGDAGRRMGGTGLGLAISRQLVRLMGGELHVESRPGEGSRFWFDLRLPALAPASAAPTDASEPAGYEGRRRRVIVADDVAGNRAMLMDLLTLLGFEVQEVSGGASLVEAAARAMPDLVLTDVAMPGIDGLEATRRIRRLPGGDAVVIVCVSANASAADRSDCLAAGANDFVSKPVDRQVLMQCIGTHLGLRWTGAKA